MDSQNSRNIILAKIKFFRHNFPLFSKKLYLLRTYQMVQQWVFINNACYIFRQKQEFMFEKSSTVSIFWKKTQLFRSFLFNLLVFRFWIFEKSPLLVKLTKFNPREWVFYKKKLNAIGTVYENTFYHSQQFTVKTRTDRIS